MRHFKLLAAALLLSAIVSQGAHAADRVYVMRHLQKSAGVDPPLSPEGAAGADRLAALLAPRGIAAIFATPTRRAMATARPLAAKLGIAVTRYDPADPEALVRAVAAIPGAVLIVGHSNTVPDLVARFGGRQKIVVTEQDYGTIFLVRPQTGAVREIGLKPRR